MSVVKYHKVSHCDDYDTFVDTLTTYGWGKDKLLCLRRFCRKECTSDKGSRKYNTIIEWVTKYLDILDNAVYRKDGRKITKTTLKRVGATVGRYKIIGVDLSGEERDTKYILECDICSQDEELYPLGSIKSNWGNLNKGQVPCGCAVSKGLYSESQSRVLVERVCSKDNYTFNGWVGDYTEHSKTFLDLTCTNGHRYKTCSIVNFIRGHRCSPCAYENNTWAYYDKRPDDIDTLYLIELELKGKSTLKLGRSFDLSKRLKRYELTMDKATLLDSVEGIHVDIYNLEKELLQKYRLSKDDTFPYFKGGRTECFVKDLLPTLMWEFDNQRDYLYQEVREQQRYQEYVNTIGWDYLSNSN